MIISVSNLHADRIATFLRREGAYSAGSPRRACRIVEQDEGQFGNAVLETDASRAEIEEAMASSIEVRNGDDRCSAIDWVSEHAPADPLAGQTLAQAAAATVRVTLLGYDMERELHDSSHDVESPPLADLSAALDWVAATSGATRDCLDVRGRQIWVRGACAVLALIDPDGLSAADRAVADRVAGLDEIEPAPGWEDRAVDRAKRDGVLPT